MDDDSVFCDDPLRVYLAEVRRVPPLDRVGRSNAARHISLSEHSVRSMIASGTLLATREGRAVRLDRQALDRWIEVRQVRG